VRPPSSDTAKHDQAIEAIFESVGGEVARRDGEERGGGWGVFEQIVGLAFRNDGIEKGLALAFPQLSDEARQYLEPLVISVFEGKLAPRDLAEAEFRSLAVDELKGRFKDEAQVIGIVDFLWDVKVKAARSATPASTASTAATSGSTAGPCTAWSRRRCGRSWSRATPSTAASTARPACSSRWPAGAC
jgi:hypothetical protein